MTIKENVKYLTNVNLAIDKIAELEKENEQLKEKIKHRNCIDCSNHGKQIEVLKLKAQIEEMKNFVKSMYEANKNDAYCREYLGTILNEWS